MCFLWSYTKSLQSIRYLCDSNLHQSTTILSLMKKTWRKSQRIIVTHDPHSIAEVTVQYRLIFYLWSISDNFTFGLYFRFLKEDFYERHVFLLISLSIRRKVNNQGHNFEKKGNSPRSFETTLVLVVLQITFEGQSFNYEF